MKKLNKLFAILVAMAMVLSLGVVAAFADDPTYYTSQPLNIKIETVQNEVLPTLADAITFTTSDEGAAPIETINLTKTDFTKDTTETDVAKDAYLYSKDDVVPAADKFGHAGVYTYTINQTLTVSDPVHAGAVKNLKADKATYTMKVYVVDKNGNLEIQAVTLSKDDQKVNTTDDGTQDPIGYDNDYFETLPTGPNTDAQYDDYVVEKQVADGQGDKTKRFHMEGTLTLAGLTDQQVTAFIRDKNGAEVTDTNRTVSFDAATGVFSADIADDEQIVFKGLPIGTAYTADEVDASEGTTPGKYKAEVTGGSGTFETRPAKTTVTNTIYEETPAGILISNLPYIALALVAIGGLVAYVVVRRRNADEA